MGSRKLNGPCLRYEIGTCMQTRWIVWFNGPFPCGEWSDLAIARSSLVHLLESWERHIADAGHLDSNSSAVTPTRHHLFIDRQRATVRDRHETVNERLKNWVILSQRYRHPLENMVL